MNQLKKNKLQETEVLVITVYGTFILLEEYFSSCVEFIPLLVGRSLRYMEMVDMKGAQYRSHSN